MYYPYFRGRQYELLALKDWVKNTESIQRVIPIVEPIKIIPAFNNCLAMFKDKKYKIGVVINPNVGDLTGQCEIILTEILKYGIGVIPIVIVDEHIKDIIKIAESHGIRKENLAFRITDKDSCNTYKCEINYEPQFVIWPDERFSYRENKTQGIILGDRFKKRKRNADYPEEESFSEDHLYYKQEGYIGYGDYSIVGSEYNETGFAPYAVAIHIVYFEKNEAMRIRHFVSDSNDDISDVAGKFYEAVIKLDQWYRNGHADQLTGGLKMLLDHCDNKTYPGLPMIKKLSIMHHLELVNRYLEHNM